MVPGTLVSRDAERLGHLTDFARCPCLRSDAEGGANRAGAAAHSELVVDVLEMRLDSRRRDEEPATDLAIREAPRDEGEHVELALRKSGQVGSALAPRAQPGEVRPEQR